MSIIGLISDFGTRDHYVACMKGLILQINPTATIVDVSHEINAQDILHAAFVLRQSLPWFPPKTVFVAVVDPTVGTQRRILAARYSDRFVIAPDNGLLTLLHRETELQEIRVVENRQFFGTTSSNTFHGRDILAPVAAHLSRGTSLDHLGPVADRMEILEHPLPHTHRDGTIDGEVMLIDGFGNLITNIPASDLSGAHTHRHHFQVTVGPHDVGPIRTTYADVAAGEPIALIGSTQMLEIAVNRQNAAQTLKIARGTPVHLR